MGQNERLLEVASARYIPPGWAGLWAVYKHEVKTEKLITRGEGGRVCRVEPGVYTALYCLTEDKLHLHPPGTCVMDDTRPELESHLGFMRQAEGRVLVTGLGLGCVVRGLLAKRSVTAVTVIEKSADVLKLVKPHMPRDERLEIIHADALTWAGQTDRTFDYAWHDLWTDRTKGEPHLALWHTRLLLDMRDKVTRQGAWDYPRWTRQFLAAKCGIELVR